MTKFFDPWSSSRANSSFAVLCLLINLQYAFEEPLGERRAGQGCADLTRQFQCGRQALGEDLGALPSNGFRFFRSFEPLPGIQHVALSGTDMQDFLKAFEVQPGLVTKQLALMGRNHVQANHDLNQHLRGGAHSKLAQMKYMAGGGGTNTACVFY